MMRYTVYKCAEQQHFHALGGPSQENKSIMEKKTKNKKAQHWAAENCNETSANTSMTKIEVLNEKNKCEIKKDIIKKITTHNRDRHTQTNKVKMHFNSWSRSSQ